MVYMTYYVPYYSMSYYNMCLLCLPHTYYRGKYVTGPRPCNTCTLIIICTYRIMYMKHDTLYTLFYHLGRLYVYTYVHIMYDYTYTLYSMSIYIDRVAVYGI